MGEIPLDLDACEELATELANLAIEQMREAKLGASDVSTKADASDLVTTYDLAIETEVRRRIQERFPGHVVCGEEFGSSGVLGEAEYVWYVDPIDGTTNFASSLPWSSFSLCLADRGGLVLGVVADPYRSEIFSARRGSGAQLGNRAVSCREIENLAGRVVLSELAGSICWPGLLELIQRLAERGCVTRIMGSSALSLASLGAGRAAGVVLGGANPIDVGAGVLVAKEAGALVFGGPGTDPVLGVSPIDQELLLAAAPGATGELLEVIRTIGTQQAQ
jgi:myo-inositol-1(or 4)-monophosphatase